MYTEDDLRNAVASGAISGEAADALRNSVRASREAPAGDEEHFRLINSFNDIFVAIGAVIMLFAVGAIGQAIGGSFRPDYGLWNSSSSTAEIDAIIKQGRIAQAMEFVFAGLFVAITAWPLAEFFTRKRRMAFPSIILLLAFVGGVFVSVTGLAFLVEANDGPERLFAVLLATSGIVAAGAAWLHWKRFAVPITVAAGSAALAVTIIALLIAAIGPESQIGDTENIILGLVFAVGLAIFAFAMWWDMSDRERQTRRSDVAFWLHLLAAPMIAHPLFYWIGVTEGSEISAGASIGVFLVYIALGVVALAVDRRALLVSALAYVLITLTFLFDRFGAVELNVALTALVIGSALLTLSAFWTPIRQKIVGALPAELQNRLPVSGAITTG